MSLWFTQATAWSGLKETFSLFLIRAPHRNGGSEEDLLGNSNELFLNSQLVGFLKLKTRFSQCPSLCHG